MARAPPAARPAGRAAGIAALVVVFVVVFDHASYSSLPAFRREPVPVFTSRYAILVFFLVSGYVIPAALERRGDVRAFWIDRVFRVCPLAVVAAVAVVLAVPAAVSTLVALPASALSGVLGTGPLVVLAAVTVVAAIGCACACPGACWAGCRRSPWSPSTARSRCGRAR